MILTPEGHLVAAILQMTHKQLSFTQFHALLKTIDSDLGPAAAQLWNDGVNTEEKLKRLTKEDMHWAAINLGDSVLIYDHYHPAGQSQLHVTIVDACCIVCILHCVRIAAASCLPACIFSAL